MANPAAELRQQAQNRWPGATIAERARRHIKHRHPDDPNKFMVDATIGPLHIRGTETEIDTTIQPTTGAWQYEMVLADYHIHLRDTFNVGDIMEYRDPDTDEWVIFDPQSLNWIDQDTSRQQIAIKQAVAAQVTADVVDFPAAWGSGRHFQYQAQTGRLKKIITIDSAADLPEPTVQGPDIWLETEFTISHSSGVELYLDGQLWEKRNNVRVKTGNRIEFRDAATGSQIFWHLDFPRAWDDNGDETFGEFECRRQGGPGNLFVTVRIPKPWVDAATFPIHLDPTIDDQIAAGEDDAEQAGTDVVNNTSSIRLNSDDWGGLRWEVAPEGTIDVAYFEIYCNHPTRNDMTNVVWSAHDTASPGAFTGGFGSNGISSRTRTTNNVNWNEADLTQDAFAQSPSIVDIIQELVDSHTVTAIALIGDNDDSEADVQYTAYDGTTTEAAKIHIEYTTAAGDPEGPLVGGKLVKGGILQGRLVR